MNYLYILLVLVTAFLLFHVPWNKPQIVDISYINMDKDTDRRAFMETQLAHLAVPYRRWPGVDGSKLTTADMKTEHVGSPSFAIRHKSWDGKLRNTGVIGCWLSHKKLLQYLSTLTVGDDDLHLIIEDDINVPSSLLTDRWPSLQKQLPRDVDLVYFGITNPVISHPASNDLVKLKPGDGNWGTYAYAVRHGSITTKILPCLEHFRDPIDNQYDACFDRLNAYAIIPNLINADSEFQDKSSIDKAV
jgi:hypothetical protein